MEATPQRVIDRLLSRYEVDESGCWISLYSTGSHGYSQVTWHEDGRTRMRLGHRVSWEAVNGLIEDGLTIDHLCKVRRCINPEHLRLLDNITNAQGGGGHNVTEPEPTGRLCGKGLHELLLYPSGAVSCRECRAERQKTRYPKRIASRANRGLSPH